MTVLDLDPPQPTLRLVSSTGATSTRDHRYRDAALLHGSARDLYRQVLEASLANQVSINPDALRVVLATKQATTASPAHAFSSAGIWQLMFVDVVGWCRNRQLDLPTGCSTALLRVIEFLDVSNSFHELSDSPDALYDAIDECTGGLSDEIFPTSSRTTRPRHSSASSPTRGRGSLRSDRGTKRT